MFYLVLSVVCNGIGYLLFVKAAAVDMGVAFESQEHLTIVFNVFVFCQVFNEFNARSIANDVNVFSGLGSNPIFIAIIVFTVLLQVVLVQYGGDFVRTSPLSESQWVKCVLLGALTLPVGGLMRFIPIKDAESDFASMSDLLVKACKAARRPSGQKEQTGFSPSDLLWWGLAVIIPVLVHQHFGESWLAQYIAFMKSA